MGKSAEAKKIDYSHLSPFELKDSLIQWAKESVQGSQRTMLNAGRGNPNWIATTPREAFFLLGRFALQESKRVWDEPDLGGMCERLGIASRFDRFLSQEGPSPGAKLLVKTVSYARSELGFESDAFVHELADAVIGDNYPFPDRMLFHAERIVHRFLVKEMCDDRPPPGRYDLFAVEGGTAAMCYVLNSLVVNRVLRTGDTIALGTPIFTPYLEIPQLEPFRLKSVAIEASEMSAEGRHTWQYPESEIRKLEDPKIKAFFVVNPSNPGSAAMSRKTLDLLVEIVKTKRPDLLLLTDDVYATFVPGFRSLAAELPQNTILVYSYSKHFGCSGWRAGFLALHQDNVIDRMIARLPENDRAALSERYHSLRSDPENLKFIDRMVADSRNVALNHTAGLSLPQQAQMSLLSFFALTDEGEAYKRRVRDIVKRRMTKLFDGLGLKMVDDPLRTHYYAQLDLAAWATKVVGPEFVEYLESHHEPLDIVFALAKRHGTVLLNGTGFDGPPWSVRVALSNLDDRDYEQIGRNLMEVVTKAVAAWQKTKKGAA